MDPYIFVQIQKILDFKIICKADGGDYMTFNYLNFTRKENNIKFVFNFKKKPWRWQKFLNTESKQFKAKLKF